MIIDTCWEEALLVPGTSTVQNNALLRARGVVTQVPVHVKKFTTIVLVIVDLEKPMETANDCIALLIFRISPSTKYSNSYCVHTLVRVLR